MLTEWDAETEIIPLAESLAPTGEDEPSDDEETQVQTCVKCFRPARQGHMCDPEDLRQVALIDDPNRDHNTPLF